MASNVTKPPILDETGQEIKGKLSQILTKLPNLKSDKFISPTPFIYSETEDQVGIWKDGKPLYQKIVNYGTLPNASGSVNKAHNIQKVDNIFISGGYFVETSGSDKYYYPLVLASGSNEYNIYTMVDKTNVRVSVNRDRSSMSAIVVVQYTKTTDTAWQGGFKAYGFTPVIYSDTEREIGVWMDGKPLYEKTIKSTTTPSASAWNQIALPTGISVKTYCGYYRRSTGAVNKLSAYREDSNPAEMLFDSITNSTYYYRISSAFRANFSEIDVIIQYTKDSDTAGSGKYITLGTPSVHYDGEERVIGTWFGETLYQKTFSGLSLYVPSMSWFDTGKTIANGNKCINVICNGATSTVSAVCDLRPSENGKIYLMGMRNATALVTEFTIQYTKTS